MISVLYTQFSCLGFLVGLEAESCGTQHCLLDNQIMEVKLAHCNCFRDNKICGQTRFPACSAESNNLKKNFKWGVIYANPIFNKLATVIINCKMLDGKVKILIRD